MIRKQTLINNKFKDGTVVEHLNLENINIAKVYITQNNNKIVLDYDQIRSINKVENKISEILKKLRDKNVSQDSIDVIRYELHGHGIPNAIDNDNFSYKIGNNYLSITYFYEQKSNFFQNEWVRDSRYYFEREELPEDNK
ncbi:MAG: hypothetical protein ACOCXG_05835 [Nanoarchaeota archaeon]